MTAAPSAQLVESHDVEARFVIGGVFDVSHFDGVFAFT